MAQTGKRRPVRTGGAVNVSFDWRDPQPSTGHSETEASDPIATLIAKIDAAAVGCGVVPLSDGRGVHVARCAGGYSVEARQ